MQYFRSIFDIFFEKRANTVPKFLPIDSTEHYKKELGELFLDAVYIATKYSEIEVLLARYKYNSEREYGDIFVDLLAKVVDMYRGDRESIDCIIPVPMHWSRYILRGFDHTRYLAKGLSKKIHIPSENIVSTQWTRHQSQLSREKRLENKKNSFRMKNRTNAYETVLLIDDVISSGSTANECAKLLKKNGVKNVIGIFLASNL